MDQRRPVVRLDREPEIGRLDKMPRGQAVHLLVMLTGFGKALKIGHGLPFRAEIPAAQVTVLMIDDIIR